NLNATHINPDAINSRLYTLRGPNLSTSIPITILAGMVSATFNMSSAFHCSVVILKLAMISGFNGAWENHMTKVKKKANQVICKSRTLALLKSNRFSFAELIKWPLEQYAVSI